jgi:hypothetical protein
VHVDDRFADAGVTELVEHMIKQRPACDAYQGFWHVIGQRTHAQAETCGKNHGFGGIDGHSGILGPLFQRLWRKSGYRDQDKRKLLKITADHITAIHTPHRCSTP